MGKYDLVIFDFDGTLADTRNIIVQAKQESNARMGLPFRDEAACAATIGLTAEAGFLQMYPDASEAQIAEGARVYREIFDALKKQMPPEIFPNVKETLETLRDAGVRMSVASSRQTESLKEFLDNMKLTQFFDLTIGSNDTEKHKPNPEPVEVTLERLGFEAGQALVVGDMPFDVLMGLNAGTDACGVTYGNASAEDLSLSGATYVIDDFAELRAIVLE